MTSEKHINVSRRGISHIDEKDVASLGASYTHVKSLKGVLGPSTKKIVMYHSFIETLDGFEDTKGVDIVYLAFNRIRHFRECDSKIKPIGVLDLAGNPITSLANCPPCQSLIVSATCIEDLTGCPEGVQIIRCGHSSYLKSLKGCPKSVKLIECSCSPNLVIDKRLLPDNVELLRD
jgi:hypothetical protein